MEGPPLRVIAEELAVFRGKQISATGGNSRIDKELLRQQEVLDVFSWGKNLFLRFPQFSLKVHFLMYGSYRVNGDKKGVIPRLSLVFSGGLLNFYGCSIKLLSNSEVKHLCDEEIDIMSQKWSRDKVMRLTSNMYEALICDVLLDQNVFAGVGNIIKNEALFVSKVHPLSIIGKTTERQLETVVNAAREFSLLFYRTAKEGESIRSHLTIYGKRECPDCGERVTVQKTGNLKRISYFCPSSQRLYA